MDELHLSRAVVIAHNFGMWGNATARLAAKTEKTRKGGIESEREAAGVLLMHSRSKVRLKFHTTSSLKTKIIPVGLVSYAEDQIGCMETSTRW